MIVLALRTDSTETQIALYDESRKVAESNWESGRDLARDLLGFIISFLHDNQFELKDVGGLVCFSGPGSFTSLRIGITTMNTIAYSNNIPIVSGSGNNWQNEALIRLMSGENEKIVMPMYGAEPNITIQKK